MIERSWWPDWHDDACVIVASGPSAKDVPLDTIRGRMRVVAVNSSWRLVPWADALYACDYSWWRNNEGCPDFAGMKLTTDHRTMRHKWGIRQIDLRRDDRIVFTPVGTVGWGGNSGFQALNAVVQFGVKRIALVGFDATVAHGIHWHGPHPSGLNNPKDTTVIRWRRALDNAAKPLAEAGVTVINCSSVSALTKYPKMEFADAVDVLLAPVPLVAA